MFSVAWATACHRLMAAVVAAELPAKAPGLLHDGSAPLWSRAAWAERVSTADAWQAWRLLLLLLVKLMLLLLLLVVLLHALLVSSRRPSNPDGRSCSCMTCCCTHCSCCNCACCCSRHHTNDHSISGGVWCGHLMILLLQHPTHLQQGALPTAPGPCNRDSWCTCCERMQCSTANASSMSCSTAAGAVADAGTAG